MSKCGRSSRLERMLTCSFTAPSSNPSVQSTGRLSTTLSVYKHASTRCWSARELQRMVLPLLGRRVSRSKVSLKERLLVLVVSFPAE